MSLTVEDIKRMFPRKEYTEAEIYEKYPHAIRGTMESAGEKKDRTVMIRCAAVGCKQRRRVRTSDLHQVKFCESHIRIKQVQDARDRRIKYRRRQRKIREKLRKEAK